MDKNKLIEILYCHSESNKWVKFARIDTIKYYEINTYEREDLIARVFNKYSVKSQHRFFEFHGPSTFIHLEL